jgi:hypothetical protein
MLSKFCFENYENTISNHKFYKISIDRKNYLFTSLTFQTKWKKCHNLDQTFTWKFLSPYIILLSIKWTPYMKKHYSRLTGFWQENLWDLPWIWFQNCSEEWRHVIFKKKYIWILMHSN